MFGTPNAGSTFGQIPKLRDWLVGILTVACNIGPGWMGAAGPIIKGVNGILAGSKVITHTLEQMADESKFYRILNNSGAQVRTRYHIIAGNVLEFKPPDDDGRWNKIMESIKRQVGELVYGSHTRNDIAVAVKSILSAPKGSVVTAKEVACHHLNYFEVDVSMNHFKSLISPKNGD